MSGLNRDRFFRNFGKIYGSSVAALVRHIIECRKAFDGDFDQFLIFTIVGERSFPAKDDRTDMNFSEFGALPVDTVCPNAINIQSIADYSGIPRETVRRKVAILISKGWITRDHNGFVKVTDHARDDLEGLTMSTVRYLQDVAATFDQHCVDAPVWNEPQIGQPHQ